MSYKTRAKRDCIMNSSDTFTFTFKKRAHLVESMGSTESNEKEKTEENDDADILGAKPCLPSRDPLNHIYHGIINDTIVVSDRFKKKESSSKSEMYFIEEELLFLNIEN